MASHICGWPSLFWSKYSWKISEDIFCSDLRLPGGNGGVIPLSLPFCEQLPDVQSKLRNPFRPRCGESDSIRSNQRL